jgi:altronate dehydratase large subunit
MRDNIDINAGTILDGDESIEDVGGRIFQQIIEVASGKLTRAEILGHSEFAIHGIGPTV